MLHSHNHTEYFILACLLWYFNGLKYMESSYAHSLKLWNAVCILSVWILLRDLSDFLAYKTKNWWLDKNRRSLWCNKTSGSSVFVKNFTTSTAFLYWMGFIVHKINWKRLKFSRDFEFTSIFFGSLSVHHVQYLVREMCSIQLFYGFPSRILMFTFCIVIED